MNKSKKQEQGAALLLSVILIMSISLIICLGLVFLTFNSLISTRNKIKSVESYYAAEAGLEDSFLRLENGLQFSSSNSLMVGDNLANIEISDLISGTRTIISQGNAQERIRKLSTDYVVVFDEVSFFYGAQVGEGGIIMGNNSRIEGNVFSNGSISGGGEITGTVIVANDGNEIKDVTIGEDVYVYSCVNSDITGTLNYVSGGEYETCDYGTLVDMGPDEIESQDLPIPQEQIDNWKNKALAGGVLAGDYTLDGSETASLGPIKITGDMLIDNNSTLNLTGLVYVVGNITIRNGSTVSLDSNFGSISGIVISDGKIVMRSNANLQGSGQEGSFLMFLSTNNSLDGTNPAIDVGNNAQGAIFYASQGLIHLSNNILIREATGYQLALDNNAVISYESGLENVNFTSGPGGSRQFKNWREIE